MQAIENNKYFIFFKLVYAWHSLKRCHFKNFCDIFIFFLIYIKYLKRTPLFENLGIHKQRNQIIAISINIKQINGKTSKLYKNNLSISKQIKNKFHMPILLTHQKC